MATAIDHKSISLSWTAGDENALKYNIYQGGVNIGSTTETSYTVEGLTAETNYCFTVEAVRGVNVSESHSDEACATTGVAPKTQKIIFSLKDSYGDGWNGNELTISYEGLTDDLTLTLSSGSSGVYEIELPQGAEVTLTYTPATYYGYPQENSFEIKYEDGEIIWSKAMGELSATISHTFTVKSNDPSIEVNQASFVFGTVRAGGDFWTEKEIPSFDVEVTAKNTAIKSVSIDDDFFTSDKDLATAAGQTEFNFTVSYNKEAEEGEKSGNIVVTYMNGEEEATVEIPMTATAYEPVQGDVVENPIEVTFDENGVYTYNINSLDGFYDDYVFSPNEQYDADAKDMAFSFTLTEDALVHVYDTDETDENYFGSWCSLYGDFTVENGPQYKKDYPGEQLLSAGTYYVVVSPNGLPFNLKIEKSSVPAPIIYYSSPQDGAANNDNPMLEWTMQYAETYKVMLGTSEDALEEVAAETAIEGQTEYSFQTSELQNNTKYYWQVIATNEAGTTTGEVRSFVTLLDVPQITSATSVNLYPGETTTITWDAVANATSYKVYNGEWNVLATLEATETSYDLSGLEYNMTGHNITVTATQDLGESLKSTAVVVKVAGTFPLTVNVKDSKGNTIKGATVTVITTSAYDEFYNDINDIEPIATDDNGMAVFTLPLLGYNNYYGSSYYQIQVSMSPYKVANEYIYYYSISNNTPYSKNLTLYLPTPSSIYPENYEYMLLAGGNLTLNWTDVEGATGYKVYRQGAYNNSTWTYEYVLLGTSTGNTYTAVAEYDAYGSKYAVSAVFEGDIESDKAVTYDYIYVLGTGDVKGLVKDTEGNLVAGAALELSGTNGFGEDIHILETESDGTFLVEDVIEGTYSLTVSHYNYEVATVSGISVNYNIEYDLGTIQLTPKASIENVTVTADNNGNVSWTGDYTKWNVYRRNTNAPQELTSVATKLEATSTTDTEWETLEPGTYQYGVAALVEPQAQTRGTEVIFEEGFENNGTNIPTGWTRWLSGDANNWTVGTTTGGSYQPHDGVYCAYSNGKSYNGGYAELTTKEIVVAGETYMTFYYLNIAWGSDKNNLIVKVIPQDTFEENEVFNINKNPYHSWTQALVDLSGYQGKTIKIKFICENGYGYTAAIDDIVITGEVTSETETQIVWSDAVVKQGPATFIGEDTENPTAWNVDANWSTGSVPADGAEVVIAANAAIANGNVNVANLTINSGKSLTVGTSTSLTVTGTITQESPYSIVIMDGGQIFQNNSNVTAIFKMNVENPSDWSNTTNNDGWQFISMPFNDAYYSDFAGTYNPSTGQNTCDYDLYKYDGSQNYEWQNYREQDWTENQFKSGTGYLASRKEVSTVNMYGTLNTATSKVWGQYPINNDKVLANFKLLGNPFTFDMDMAKLNSSGTMVTGYAVVNANGEYEYKTDGTVKVGDGFFVKLATNYAHLDYDHNAKSTRSASNNSLNITATGNAGEDNVIINLAGKSEGFDKLQNFNDAIATVYVAEDGKNYGIYNCDADVQEVELSFNANQMGNYTISIEPNGKFQTVTLVDRFTGIETNMLVEDYHFTAMSNVNTNRFIVRMVNGQESTDNSHFVYQSGEDLIIDAEGTVQIIDVMGRVLVSDEVESTNNRINVSGFQNGTYMVRVINGSEVKVEKVVIY